MVLLRRCAPFLLGALLATGCQDPAPTTGTLVVAVTGLPAGAEAAVRVVGPNQFIQMVRNTMTLENLVPGEYIIVRDSLLFSNTRFGVDSAQVRDTLTIVRGRTESVNAVYGVASGSLNLTIAGLPNGITAQLRVTGPGASGTFDQIVGSSTLLTSLRPGSYKIAADAMTTIFGDKFVGAPATQNITIPASMTPVDVVVNYMVASGTISLNVIGLSAATVTPPIVVTGPGGFQFFASSSVMIRGLDAGTYTISSSNVSGNCPNLFTASQTPFADVRTLDVALGETKETSITYSERVAPPEWLNFKIESFVLTQATQNAAGTVPLISGKPALARVFVTANQCNAAKPKVRVTISGSAPITIDAPEESVRQGVDQSVFTSSWNAVVPAGAIQPGATALVEVDPLGEFTEPNESDNRMPASAGTQLLDVRSAPTVGLRLVPVTQTVAGSPVTGDVTPANLDQFMDFARKLHPVGTYDVDIREPYTSTTTALQAGGGNWVQVLGEIDALRQADASPRYYYGVAKVNYSSGVAGIAYVPGRTGLGWDNLGLAASRVMAHEIGHNYGRFHTPCGNPAGIDPNYPSTGPYSGGRIGVPGWDPVEGFKSPADFTDVMGYCTVQWISDYTYVGMLNWLINAPPSLTVMGAEQPSLLIWGRLENGHVVLEPAFEISARPSLPSPGPYRVSALDASGNELFGVSFAGQRIADLPGDAETFAFTVPLSALRGRTMASMRLAARGRTVTTVASADIAADPSATVTRVSARLARVRWDAARFPVVMVRDPVRGQVLSFARGGDVTIVTPRNELELNFSNGLRTSRRLTQLK